MRDVKSCGMVNILVPVYKSCRIVKLIMYPKILQISVTCLKIRNLFPFFFFQTEAHLDTLISEQASFILARSGVGNLYTVYQENRGQRVSQLVC